MKSLNKVNKSNSLREVNEFIGAWEVIKTIPNNPTELGIFYFFLNHKVLYQAEIAEQLILNRGTVKYHVLKLLSKGLLEEVNPNDKDVQNLINNFLSGGNAPKHSIRFYRINQNFSNHHSKTLPSLKFIIKEKLKTTEFYDRLDNFKHKIPIQVKRRKSLQKKRQHERRKREALDKAARKVERKADKEFKLLQSEITKTILNKKLSFEATIKLIDKTTRATKDLPQRKRLREFKFFLARVRHRGAWEEWKDQQRIKLGV